METINDNKHYFSNKGKNAEGFLHGLALKTFLSIWCFLNLKLPNRKELCDLLVIYDDIIIIWQTKDIKLDEKGFYKRKEVEKNFRQLHGAKRELLKLKTQISFANTRGNLEKIDASAIKRVFLISTFTGSGQICIDPIEEFKEDNIHVFTGDDIQILLKELDTIHDFVEYLIKRESFLLDKKCSKIIVGGEKELLGYYLANNRAFIDHDEENARFIISNYWDDLSRSQKYLTKRKTDEISYFWDFLVEEVIGRHKDAENYEQIAREIARTTRFQRRCLSQHFLNARLNACNNKSFRRIVSYCGITYCFLFQDSSDTNNRHILLAAVCHIGRGKFQKNKIVIGIATEPNLDSFDFILMDNESWTEEDQINMERLQEDLGFFNNLVEVPYHSDEYPVIK